MRAQMKSLIQRFPVAVAVGQFGKGRVLANTTDPAPHWGCNFVFWQQYPKFWTNAARWLASAPSHL
jgi:uncharacterized membrane protein